MVTTKADIDGVAHVVHVAYLANQADAAVFGVIADGATGHIETEKKFVHLIVGITGGIECHAFTPTIGKFGTGKSGQQVLAQYQIVGH